ncbi:unnamed protein product [Oncorhynchus mykiss]|uniref:Synembryn n=1 Tax=Oncorhynchus mykiss TaxID=8022 RepID=A0A060X4N3_ONCMY|nr:unnamed protein product [Oncorhynchus mykiss]
MEKNSLRSYRGISMYKGFCCLLFCCLSMYLYLHHSFESNGGHSRCCLNVSFFVAKWKRYGQKLKEKRTPILNLCQKHRETRHYLRQQILPPLRDMALRPEQGATVRGRGHGHQALCCRAPLCALQRERELFCEVLRLW